MASQISSTSFRFASFDRLDLTDPYPSPIRSLVALLLSGIVSLASRYNYCSTFVSPFSCFARSLVQL